MPPRLPLGDAFAGECRAPGNTVQPDEARTRELCNLGYGRGRCEQFPAASAVDAVRFHIAKDAGESIELQYVFEKGCWPGEQGTVDFSTASDTLRRQANAFLDSYLRRRDRT